MEDYETQKTYYDTQKQFAQDELVNGIGSGKLKPGTDEWYAMQDKIYRLEEQSKAYNMGMMGQLDGEKAVMAEEQAREEKDEEERLQEDIAYNETLTAELPADESLTESEQNNGATTNHFNINDFAEGMAGDISIVDKENSSDYISEEDFETQMQGLNEGLSSANRIIAEWDYQSTSEFAGLSESVFTEEEYIQAQKDIEEIPGQIEALKELRDDSEHQELVHRIDEELDENIEVFGEMFPDMQDMTDEEIEIIMDTDFDDLNFSDHVTKMELEVGNLIEGVQDFIVEEFLGKFDDAVRKWEKGEDWYIKDCVFIAYGEHVPLEDINLNDLRNDYLNKRFEDEGGAEYIANVINNYVKDNMDEAFLEKTNYEEIDGGYVFEVPSDVTDYMIDYAQAREALQKRKGTSLTATDIFFGVASAGLSPILGMIFSFVYSVGSAVGHSSIRYKQDEWDDIGSSILQAVTNRPGEDLVVIVNLEPGDPEAMAVSKKDYYDNN